MGRQQYTAKTYQHKRLPSAQQWMILLTIALILVDFSNSLITCGPGIYSPGDTIPHGDISLEYNNVTLLEITCVLNPDHETVKKVVRSDAADGYQSKQLSQRIGFYRNNERVSKNYVSIINSTAAQLRVPNLSASADVYVCLIFLDNNNVDTSTLSTVPSTSTALRNRILNTDGSLVLELDDSHIGVCLNHVYVGYKPFNITNFSCISNNWESLTCNWTKPENPIKTTYTLYLGLPGRFYSKTIMNCPTNSDVKNNTCYWDLSTTPLYRQSYEYYYFTILGNNALGKSITHIRFHHYANIIPARPTKLVAMDRTESSVKLAWSIGTMSFYSYGLIFKIQYKSQWDSKLEQWDSIIINDACDRPSKSHQTTSAPNLKLCLENHADNYYFNVTGLKYAFTRYDICINYRTALAVGDDKWSAPSCITVDTKPTIPKRPPRTEIGSFEYVTLASDKSKRDVFIYWQTIEDNEKCGESFEYITYYNSTTADQQTITHLSDETHINYAKFNSLSTNIEYEFIVISYNKEGFSTEYSTVFLPSESDTLDKPLSFTKMVYDQLGIFELSWKGADAQILSTANQLEFYSIFWCEKDQINPQQCNGYMNWMRLPISLSCYNTTQLDEIDKYIFAISRNSENHTINGIHARSSGMVWESASDGNVKNVWVSVIGSTFVGLSWNIYCDNQAGLVVAYHIYFCPLFSKNNLVCKERMITDSNIYCKEDCKDSTLVSNLRPNTAYFVAISIVMRNRETINFNVTITTLSGPILK